MYIHEVFPYFINFTYDDPKSQSKSQGSNSSD